MTAVEWLVNEMPVIDWSDPYWKIKLEKSKEMEKQQIMNAWLVDGYTDISGDNWKAEFNEYYNETYKNTKE